MAEAEDVYTISDYLEGLFPGYTLTDKTFKAILSKYEIDVNTPVEDVPEKTKDLAEADIAELVASTSSVTGSIEDSDGGWKHREGGSQMTNFERKLLLQRANNLRKKYGLGKANIKIINLW